MACGTGAPNCGPGGNANSVAYGYTLGPAGNRTSVTELAGRTVTYGYDDLYRLTSETIAGAASQNGSIGYVYDAVGNRQSLTSTVAAITAGTLFYDANDRLSTDIYDNDGNTVSSGSIVNVYDFENHLVQHGAVTIVYDGDGNRASKTAGGVTTKYLVDTNSVTGYAQVLEELNNSGTVTRKYTYGLQLISENQLIGSTQTVTFYGYDGHGSVRQLTSSTGAVTDTYTYDAFGNILNTTGSTPNNYKFAGEQFDPDLGLYYNRARYLDVRQGRFWGMDSLEGSDQDVASLHKYLYVRNDPIDLADASGAAYFSDFETGNAVHREIGAQFAQQFGTNACVDQQIINILNSGCGLGWQVGLPFPGGLRPDLANIATGALFEIKPIRSAGTALLQLAGYRILLSLTDRKSRSWHYGSAAEFIPRTVIVLGLTRVAYVAPPLFGVIVYYVADARDAFDLAQLGAASITLAVLGEGAVIPAASNVISISTGQGLAAAAASAQSAEVNADVGVSIVTAA